jgi:hypothetical protein
VLWIEGYGLSALLTISLIMNAFFFLTTRCKESAAKVNEENFPARLEDECTPVGLRRQKVSIMYNNILNLFSMQSFQRYKSMQPNEFSAEMTASADRSKKRLQKQSRLEQLRTSPLTPLITKKPPILAPETQLLSPVCFTFFIDFN